MPSVDTCAPRSTAPEADVDLLVQTSPVVLDDLWHGRRVCEQTIAAGEIRFTGPGQLVQGFRHWFRPRRGSDRLGVPGAPPVRHPDWPCALPSRLAGNALERGRGSPG